MLFGPADSSELSPCDADAPSAPVLMMSEVCSRADCARHVLAAALDGNVALRDLDLPMSIAYAVLAVASASANANATRGSADADVMTTSSPVVLFAVGRMRNRLRPWI
jgi:hypothetical protein